MDRVAYCQLNLMLGTRSSASQQHERAALSLVIARLDRAIQYSEKSIVEQKSRGVLDAPPARGMTGAYAAPSAALHDFDFLFCLMR